MLTQDSTSYRTFKGNLDVLNYSRPMWVALENVDVGDCSDDDSNGAVISKLLKETGYHTRVSKYFSMFERPHESTMCTLFVVFV